MNLPMGLESSLNPKQAIKHFNLSSDAFFEKLKSALSDPVFGEAGTAMPSGTKTPKVAKQKSRLFCRVYSPL